MVSDVKEVKNQGKHASCAFCGKEFVITRDHKQYCDNKCYCQARRKKSDFLTDKNFCLTLIDECNNADEVATRVGRSVDTIRLYFRHYGLSFWRDKPGFKEATVKRAAETLLQSSRFTDMRSRAVETRRLRYGEHYRSPRGRQSLINHLKKRTISDDTKVKIRESWTSSRRKKKSDDMFERWSDTEFKNKQVRLVRLSCRIKPNKLELQINELLRRWCPNTFKYVGNGQFTLGGKCPDFVNVNGKKQVVEVYGDYWHKGEVPQERIDLFSSYGYQTLILWEHETEDLTALKIKVEEFARS